MYQPYIHDCARQQFTPLCPDKFETYDDARRHLHDQHGDLNISPYGFDPDVCEIVACEIRDGGVIPEALAHIVRPRETGAGTRTEAVSTG